MFEILFIKGYLKLYLKKKNIKAFFQLINQLICKNRSHALLATNYNFRKLSGWAKKDREDMTT